MIASSMLDLVGHTPLVRVRASATRTSIWAKMEHLNPGGSVKDRICAAMIEDAEARGLLEHLDRSSSRRAETQASGSRSCVR